MLLIHERDFPVDITNPRGHTELVHPRRHAGLDMLMFGHYTASGLLIQTDSASSDINFTAGGAAKDLDIPYTFGDGEWHHIAVTYEASADLWRVYFDGEEVATLVKANVAWGGTLKLGAFAGGADFMTGQMEDFFFSTLLFNPLEIKKTASTRITHSKNVSVNNQLWSFNHYDTATSDLASPLSGVVLDLKPNKAYVDLYAAETTDSVEAKLQDCGTSALTVPVRTFDRTFTSDPGIDVTPIDTFLASDPTSIEVLKLIAGKWSVVADGNSLIDVANTGDRAMSGDLSSTTPSVSSPVRVIISTVPAALAVSQSRENIAGIMELQWGGFTKFVGGTHPDAYATLTAALAAAVAGDCILVAAGYTISAAETISVADILIVFKPGVKITVDTAIATGALLVSAARVDIVGARYEAAFAGTLGSFIQLTASADDCNIVRAFLEANDAGLTVTQALDALASSERNEFRASILATLGVITTPSADAGTANDITIRG